MDEIIRGTAANGSIRAFAANTRDMTETARKIHHTSPVATAALGRLMTAAGMMGMMMKGEKDVLSITIKGDGPMAGLTVSADPAGNVKGFVYNPQVPVMKLRPGKLDVGGAIGNGTMTVVRDLGLREPYSGQIRLQTGEIGDDLAYYFMTSEQVPSSVGLGVLVDRDESVLQAGGFIIQLMPDAEESAVERLERNLKGIDSVTGLLRQDGRPENMLGLILDGLEFEELERQGVRFHCNCSRDRVMKALISLGPSELKSLIDEGKPAELKCEFCNSVYRFDIPEMETILEAMRNRQPVRPGTAE